MIYIKRIFLLFSVSLAGVLQAQNCTNIIPNPSFESNTGCPFVPSQMDLVNNWMQGGGGSSDYFNVGCGYLSPPSPNDPQTPIPDGDGYVGFYSIPGSTFEYVGTCLTNSMTAGQTYSLDIGIVQSFGGNTLELTLFGSPNCADLPFTGGNCPSGINGWQELGSSLYTSVAITQWGTTTITFTPSVDINAIVLGNSCANPPYPYSYYMIDNLDLICVTPLPVGLGTFTAGCQGSNRVLSWSTASENNNDYFTIERSCNGQTFEKVGTVNGAGNSSFNLNYSFTDNSVDSCDNVVSYYRLSQVDFDGTVNQLGVRAINCDNYNNNGIEIIAFENQIEIDFSGSYTLDVYNTAGQLVLKNENLEGNTKTSLDQLSIGTYFIEVNTYSTLESKRKKVIVL